MKVSIVTPSFNQGPFLERTLRSVLCQDHRDIEYIVVDGASTDDTSNVLERYRRHLDHVIIEKDRGQADALNKGFRLATGDVLAYLNSDDCYADPGVVSRIVRHFTDPAVDVVYGCRLYISEAGQFMNVAPHAPFDAATLRRADYIAQECAFWSRRIFERAGPRLDDSFQFALDYELWMRFLAHGARFVAIADEVGLFRCHESQKSIARWHDVGLPEIARLQRAHGVEPSTELEMRRLFEDHMHGTGRAGRLRLYLHQQKAIWRGRLRRWTRRPPLDSWCLEAPLPGRIRD